MIKRFLLSILIFCLMTLPVYAVGTTINFAWDPNIESDLAGYRLYQSNISGSYIEDAILDIPAGTTTASIVVADGTYYWVLTAYDMTGNESAYSNEVTSSPDAVPDAPGNFRIIP